MLPLGLIAWLLIGLTAGLLASRMLPPGAAPSRGFGTVVATLGAIGGGLAATALGFGGLVGFDVRALVIATLGAIALLLVARWLQLRRA
ncbi:MAG: GlsB/YeaQ/YmgE family stress response membrane protein [Acidobacteriota bacterium]